MPCLRGVSLLLSIVVIVAYFGEITGSKESALSVEQSCHSISNVSVTVTQGQLRGFTLISRRGHEYYGFKGIPYAKTLQRFEAPVDADSWDGLFYANKTAPPCSQFDFLSQRYVGVEDCLTLDIYTPKIDGSFPVVFFIHGGGFQSGTGTIYEGKYFADASAVLVTINYRLGAFGFLNTEDDQVFGNMGLKDQTKALEWVKLNIKQFGGDPPKVSIVGNSAGAASAHYHMLSPLSKDLFSTAFSQSGTALNPWAFQRNPLKNALRLAEYTGCNATDIYKMVACLRTKSAREIVRGQTKFREMPIQFDVFSMTFTPSAEIATRNNKPFLLASPYAILKEGNIVSEVPWLISLTSNEGIFWTAPYLNQKKLVNRINEEWDALAPKIFAYEDEFVNDTQREIVSRLIKDTYLKGRDISPSTRNEISNIYTDRYFANGVIEAIQLHQKSSSNSPIFAALFNYTGINSIIEDFFMIKQVFGPTHSDEHQYMFNQSHGSIEYEAGTKIGEFSDRFVRLIVSFADNRRPTATWSGETEWNPVSLHDQDLNCKWYVINKDTSTVGNIFKMGYKFWKSLSLPTEKLPSSEPTEDPDAITDELNHTELR